MEWSLYNKKGYLKPLVFSNGKSQLDVVKEIITEIKNGHKIIIVRGICGTGKSAIALNVAKELGRTSIVVPVKPLQKQYQEDYTDNLYILKDKKKLKISIIDGRNNHKCKFMGDCTADDKSLPCTIEIKDKNSELIKEYLDKNKFIDSTKVKSIKGVRRKSIAPACPHWSPIICKDWFENDYKIEDSKEINYKGLNDKEFTYYKREDGCGYYSQFMSYINSDVIIFNSKKYDLENLMDRKPATELEVIDECDEFLDNLANEKKINLNRLSRSLTNIRTRDVETRGIILEINEVIVNLLKNETENEIFLIKDTRVGELLGMVLDNPELIDQAEDDSSDYLYGVYNIGLSFRKFFDETYVTFHKDERGNVIVGLITINLEKRLQEFLDKNKVILMMSGTVHSEMILEKVFGINDFKIIDAETNLIGKINIVKTGLEKNFNYQLLQMPGAREKYLKALSKCIGLAKKPVLVQVNAFSDLPSNDERLCYGLDVKTRKELEDEQFKYPKGELVQKFKAGEIDVLYSTKCTRGVDFPGEICNSIVFTKYPFPNIGSLFWKVFKKSKPEYFSLFYLNKARRELLQRIYRGLRSEEDSIDLLSPDLRVLEGVSFR